MMGASASVQGRRRSQQKQVSLSTLPNIGYLQSSQDGRRSICPNGHSRHKGHPELHISAHRDECLAQTAYPWTQRA